MIKAIVIEKGSATGTRIADRIGSYEEMELIGSQDGKCPGEASKASACCPGADVIFCFGDNRTILENLETAAACDIPVIAGTMGFSEEEMDYLKNLADRTRCVLIPAIGLNDAIVAGAVRAARWVIHQQKGLYDMRDVV